jgi:energy-converting hydrogenase Eha subunit F
MIATGYLQKQVENLAKLKRGKVFTKAFFLKLAVLVILALLTLNIYHQSQQVENKMKGFDPF